MTPDDLGYWIKKFAIKYRSLTTRSPTILSTTEWLETCLGTTGMNWIPASSRLWIIHYSSFPGPIPSHWSTWTFWRSDASKGVFNYNLFNGNALQLKSFATTSP
ncbi:hypothetical protein FRC03_005255 [Tulasnella sp. 419]|nr:hypothetical protein FRC03_005255 [Tulasnella sp. 419]